MIVRSFSLQDIDSFQGKFIKDNEKFFADMMSFIADYKCDVLTLWHEDTRQPMAFVGITKHRKGVGEFWLLPSVHVDKYPLTFFKAIKTVIYKMAIPMYNLHRAVMTIEKGWSQGEKFAQKLGFEFESTWKKYDGSKDFNCYVRLNHG
jgi:hypothetical protein